MQDKEAKGYINEIRKNIGIGGKRKKEYLRDLSERVYEYCEGQKCSRETLCEIFGQPVALASEFLEATPKSELNRKLNTKRIILYFLITAIVIYLAFIVISLIDVHQEAHGYFEEEILMIFSCIYGGV